ncbi:ORC1-type DNA replication protein [Halorussus caseinilyticus]|uniref:ORC1-type DNA replication protein n=1 Tax=Halorussus caseinilyticus TaxID=3034025 RepID=A0ABD5WNI8_9EURY
MADDPEEGMLSWDESVFRNEHVFEIDYVPETFAHRESEMRSLKYALRPAARGSRPLNVIARGPPGTGKTTAVQKVFGELGAQTDVRTVRVNCQVDSTRYSVFSRIFEGIFEYEPPSSGISFKKLFRQITEKLVEEDEVLVVALDDVNYLFYEGEASDTLYSLLRAHEAHSGAKIGVIVVLGPEPRCHRGLGRPRPERLPPRRGVLPGVRPRGNRRHPPRTCRARFPRGRRLDRSPDEVAELTAESGDLRVGIDLLRRAGLNAEMRASRTVSLQDVEEAYEKSKYVHLSHSLQALSDSEIELLEVIAQHDGERAGDVYDAFHDQTGLGYTRYSEIINKLDQLDIIDATYTNVEGRGRSRQLSLRYEPDAVLNRLEGS